MACRAASTQLSLFWDWEFGRTRKRKTSSDRVFLAPVEAPTAYLLLVSALKHRIVTFNASGTGTVSQV